MSPVTLEQRVGVNDYRVEPAQAHTTRESQYEPNQSKKSQIIAHRGYKHTHCENTLGSIQDAVRAGCHSVETDVHLTRDGEVVLVHDQTLERCFGVKKRVCDCEWGYLQTLRTVRRPGEDETQGDRIYRLEEVLEYLAQPEIEHVGLLLDIKLDNPLSIMRSLAKLFTSIPSTKPWHDRVILGCWTSAFLPECAASLPLYRVALICFDVGYARRCLRQAKATQGVKLSFSINQKVLMGPLGWGFLDELRAARARVYVWTVNEANLIQWALRRGVEGVITDEPGIMAGVLEGYENQGERLRFSQVIEIWVMAVLVVCLGWMFRWKHPIRSG